MKRIKIIASIMIFLSFVLASSIVFFLTSKRIENDTKKNLVIAEHVYDSVYNQLIKPITVAKTMASDTFLSEKLRLEGTLPESRMEALMAEYLKEIRTRLNYSSAFVISEQAKRYYTANGIAKLINPQKVPYDIWYQLFIDTKKNYDLDTDRDQSNEYRWTVFVNHQIKDEKGNFLGVCGVGVIMDEIRSLFTSLEQEYDIKVNLIDTDGLVQVDTNTTNIENAYISAAIEDKAGSNTFTYRRRGYNGIRMVRYMEDLDWYLVVQGTSEHVTFEKNLILLLLAAFLAVISIFFAGLRLFSKKEQIHRDEDILEDSVTGLPNRNYFKEAYGEMGIFTTTRYKSMVFFDIDNFESIKMNRNGDEILKNTILTAKYHIQEKGQILRWEKDSFMVILEIPVEESSQIFRKICEDLKNTLDITISAGIIEINLSDTIKINYYRAVQACYSVKETGGNGVKYHESR
ncbi:MAG: diguanylate cyclase [Treponema sp.]|nr:diguanylate cyclase [Treponema sp.]